MSSDHRSSRLRSAVGFFVSLEKRIPADRMTHKVYLVFAATLIVLPFFLSTSTGPQDEITLAGVPLPPSCVSKQLLKVECPGCGLTHSFVHLTHGNIREAIHWNRIGIPLYLFFLFQVLFRSYILRYPAAIESRPVINLQHYLALIIIAMIFINWGFGFWLGSNGS